MTIARFDIMTIIKELNFDGEISEREINTNKYEVIRHNGKLCLVKDGKRLNIFEVCEILNQR